MLCLNPGDWDLFTVIFPLYPRRHPLPSKNTHRCIMLSHDLINSHSQVSHSGSEGPLFSHAGTFFNGLHHGNFINILVIPKCILWQTVKTQMKCCIIAAFHQGHHCLRERNTIFWCKVSISSSILFNASLSSILYTLSGHK